MQTGEFAPKIRSGFLTAKESSLLITYAQNREDLILYVLLHTISDGFYVDVGANYPEIDSVTKFFYERGWSGINIEPVEGLYKQLSKERPRDINLNVAVAPAEGKLKLREYTQGYHGWSTLDKNTKIERGSKPHRDYEVPVQPLKTILEQYEVKEIDFLKIDVEGFEYEVLNSNDWSRFRPRVVVIEGQAPQCLHLLGREQYAQVFFDGLNTYFVRKDLVDIHTMNDYISVLFSGEDIMTAREDATTRQLKMTEKVLRQTTVHFNNLQKTYTNLESRWSALVQRPEQYLGLKALSKAFVKRLLIKMR